MSIADITAGMAGKTVYHSGTLIGPRRQARKRQMRELGIATGKEYKRALKAKKRVARRQAEVDKNAPGVFMVTARGYRVGRRVRLRVPKEITGAPTL
jgi:hypothetical protein